MQEYDVSGVVVLHTPEATGSAIKIDPSWSCAKMNGDVIKIRAKLEDFKGDEFARKKKLDDTVMMFTKLIDEFVLITYPYHEVLEELKPRLEELYLKPKI